MDILSAINWQHLAFVFAIMFIVVFRQPLSDLIRRTTKIGKEGLTAGSTPEAQRETPDAEVVRELLEVVGNSIVIADLEGRIKKDLKDRGLDTEADSVKVLVRHLAGTQLALSFEQTHNLIFGSQLLLLKKLNEVVGQGRPLAFVTGYVDQVKQKYPRLADWSYDDYLGFLLGRSLIVRHGDQVHITNLGVEYLTWVARYGRREDNPL